MKNTFKTFCLPFSSTNLKSKNFKVWNKTRLFGFAYFVGIIHVCTCVNYCLLQLNCPCKFLIPSERSLIHEIFINLKSEEKLIDDVSTNEARFPSFDVPEGFHQLPDIFSLAECKTIASFRDKCQNVEFQYKTLEQFYDHLWVWTFLRNLFPKWYFFLVILF